MVKSKKADDLFKLFKFASDHTEAECVVHEIISVMKQLIISMFLLLTLFSCDHHSSKYAGTVTPDHNQSVFNCAVLQDSLLRYIRSCSEKSSSSYSQEFPQIFRIYVYLDQNKDTIVDFSNGTAWRTDLKQLYGISTKGETEVLGKRLIVKYRDMDSFSAINESVLCASDDDSVNVYTKHPELLGRGPEKGAGDSRVYKLVSRDSLLLIGRLTRVPSYDSHE